ncbi:MAG TPA: phospho-N-acetylmuramoyl-pentapeptide-transferase, partial [Acidimicrobiales bacterium]|nr:phospho-N-acetylmuramoyl-pentapeptide-transferase [Acidimicrobiales bacterium]
MIALLIAGAVGLLGSILATPLLISWLRARGIGQHIREDGPEGHFSKAGTPTMGGVALITAGVVGYAVAHIEGTFTDRGLVGVGVICVVGFVGFIDDLIKVTRRRSLGLNKRAKVLGQLLGALAFSIACVYGLRVDTHLSFTRYDSLGVQLGSIGWIVVAVLVILGTTNAVNLTDGLDGLAAGSSAFNFAAFTVIGFYQLRHFNIY